MLEVDDMEFVVYLTFRCNFNCDMCTQGNEFKNSTIDELSIEEWTKFFDILTTKIQHPKIIFMGGEPLLHKDFDKIIKMAWKKGIYPHVITNAYFLEEHLQTFLDTNTGITISMHGLEKTQNSIMHTKDGFQRTVKVLEKIKNSKTFGRKVFCRINSVILPDNIDEAKEFVKFAEKFNLTDFVINHPRFTDENTEQKTIKRCEQLGLKSLQRLHLQTNKIYDFDENYIKKVNDFFTWLNDKYQGKKIVEFPNFSEKERQDYYDNKKIQNIRGNRLCVSPWNVPFILPNGDVATCLYNVVGNITKDSFWNIWNNEKSEILRKELTNNGNLPSCKRCTCFYDAHYIFAKDKIITLKNGQKLALNKELSMVLPSTDGYFVADLERKKQNGIIPVIPMAFQNKKDKKRIEDCEKIIAKFSDIC